MHGGKHKWFEIRQSHRCSTHHRRSVFVCIGTHRSTTRRFMDRQIRVWYLVWIMGRYSFSSIFSAYIRAKNKNRRPSPGFLICCSIYKRFYLYWKAFDLLNKMRYISWVVALLEACDVTNNGRYPGRHLGFNQELEIRLKPREMVIFLCVT